MSMWRVQYTRVQHIGLFKLCGVDGGACDEWARINPPLFLSDDSCASHLPRLLVCRIGYIARARFVVFVVHNDVFCLSFLEIPFPSSLAEIISCILPRDK